MTPRETLADQISTLLNDVQRERAALDKRLRSIAAGGHGRIVAAEIISQLRNRLSAHADKLTTTLATVYDGALTPTVRKQYRKIETECRDLFGECLTVLTAEAIRALQLDGGVSEIVERLLVGVSKEVSVPWSHLTALSDAEFFATASQIIRLRYPVSSIWDIPVAVHEFGHFIGPRWPANIVGESTPYQDFVSVTNLGSKSYLGEYFADMFATFIMGPSYVATCLERRFDPISEAAATHPSDRERAEWILICLELLLDGIRVKAPGSRTVEFLESITSLKRAEWKAAVIENGSKEIESKVAANLSIRAGELWRKLMEWAGTAAFQDLRLTLKLRAAFQTGDGTNSIEGATVRDIMNAAWMLRMESGADTARVRKVEQWASKELARAER